MRGRRFFRRRAGKNRRRAALLWKTKEIMEKESGRGRFFAVRRLLFAVSK
jgi:hypothetical protein